MALSLDDEVCLGSKLQTAPSEIDFKSSRHVKKPVTCSQT